MIDYEHVPFHCRKFHKHGHLFRDFPLNNPPKLNNSAKGPDVEGFTKVSKRKRHSKKPNMATPAPKTPSTSNSFEILSTQAPLEGGPSQMAPDAPDLNKPDLNTASLNTSTQPPHSIPHASIRQPNLDKSIIIKYSQMDIDNNLPSPSYSQLVKYTSDTTMPTHMEEEPKSSDLGDLDILAVELDCHQKAFDKIPL